MIMTGNELAKAIRKHSGKMYAWVVMSDDTALYIQVVKKDVLEWISAYGDDECPCAFHVEDGEIYLDKVES